MQNLYENFLHENFYPRLNYSNRVIIHVNHTKIFLHENFITKIFLRKNKANYGSPRCRLKYVQQLMRTLLYTKDPVLLSSVVFLLYMNIMLHIK